jgi:hypothetical protein
MKQETKAIAKAQTTAVAAPLATQAWGSDGIDKSDILIPKLLIMQGLSQFVSDQKASIGDIVRSTTGEILADGKKKGSVEFIPLTSFKTWIKEEKVGNKFEYRGQEPMTASNSTEPTEWTENGTEWRRNRCLNFYVLLPGDIARDRAARKKLADTGDFPDTDDVLLPCVLSFRRTSYSAGKTLITHFAKAEHMGVPPAVSIFKLFSKIEKNDQGTFQVAVVEKSGKTTSEDIVICRSWYDTLKKSTVKVDDSDLAKGSDAHESMDAEPVNVHAPEAQF